MSVTGRPAVVAALEANLRHIERIAAHIDPALAAQTPADGCWSPLEIMEHLATVERAVHKAVTGASGQPASETRTRDKDAIIAGLADYPEVLAAPDMVRPTGRYETLGDALRTFRERRTMTLDLARSLDVDWAAHHAPHPLLGPIDIGQWFLLAATHGERHATQFVRR